MIVWYILPSLMVKYAIIGKYKEVITQRFEVEGFYVGVGGLFWHLFLGADK